MKVIGLKIPTEMQKELKEAASEEFTSVSSWVRRAIGHRLEVRREALREAKASRRRK